MNISIVVLDGFGIGAMPDAYRLRESDSRANTAASLVQWASDVRRKPLEIPNLLSVGLGLIDTELDSLRVNEDLPKPLERSGIVSRVRRASLGYPGADTFAGHQTMMGADMTQVIMARVGEYLDPIIQPLESAGHHVHLLDGDKPLIVVDGGILVHDNLEADPALNWNVTGRLSEFTFDQIKDVALIVREVAPVARVIAGGGYSGLPLTSYVRPGLEGTLGVDTPATGFYKNGGFQVVHLGARIDHQHQLPQLAVSQGVAVNLIGKAADILVTDNEVSRFPGVDSEANLARTAQCMKQGRADGAVATLNVTNIQETDLAGHQQDPARYVEVIELFDNWLGEQLGQLRSGDVLIITADHGNDPLIGHSLHTREFVPVIAITASVAVVPGVVSWSRPLDSLADIGASCAQMLGIDVGLMGNGHAVELV
ncbi:MAG: phosphopentomutase [Scrofimicrobium sp.]